jgi:stearoyl-CoA desaturase (delta-9 desaturase)
VYNCRFYLPSVFLFCFVIPTVVPYYAWGESLWNGFFICALLRYCLCLHATWCVNSVAHMWGNHPYDQRINPTENLFVAFGAVGEGFHNYHHTFPSDYAASEFGWKLNITTLLIDTMAKVGMVYDRKKMSQEMINRRKQRTGDGTSTF